MKPLYHAAISPEPPHRLTPEQRTEAVDALEKKLGLEGHSRVVVLHEKLGREHVHVVWARVDTEQLRSVSDSHNYRKHEECARDLERSFGHERVQGAHAERDGVKRPDRTPSHAELRQEERTRIKGKMVKEQVSEIFKSSDNAEAFRAGLADKGYQLAKGDRRDYVIIDKEGGIHSLARRIDSVKAAELRTFMSSLDPSQVPTADAVRAPILALRLQAKQHADEADLEKALGRSGYAGQSRTALMEHQKRQKALDADREKNGAWDRIEAGERRRDGGAKEPSKPGADDSPAVESSSEPTSTRELTDEMQARLSRLLEANSLSRPTRDDPGRQNKTPGGGRTRGR